jgi:carnitine-CoA ligase
MSSTELNTEPRPPRRRPEEWVLTSVLEAQAVARPDELFLVDPDGESLSFGEFAAKVRSVATALTRRGVGLGDPVATVLGNSSNSLVLWLALMRIGAIDHPFNTEWKGALLEHVLSLARPTMVIADAAMIGELGAAGVSESSVRSLVTLVDDGAHHEGSGEQLSFAELVGEVDDPPALDLDPARPSTVVYSSGLGGRTKGCVCPNGQAYIMGWNHVACLDLGASDVCYTALPLFHSQARLVQASSMLISGGTLALGTRFSTSGWAGDVRRHGATTTTLLGPMLEFVVNEMRSDGAEGTPLRSVVVAPVPPEALREEFERLTGGVVLGVYGTTAMGNFCYNRPERRRPSSSGQILPWYEIAFDDSSSGEARGRRRGELLVRPCLPNSVSERALANDADGALLDADGWHRTGDEIWLDDDGFLYFEGRVNEYVRRRGENVSALEVEEAILGHEDVEAVACIGVPSPHAGGEDDVKVCVVLKDGASFAPEELSDFARSALPRFAVPRFIGCVETLPHDGGGEVDRAKLRSGHVADPGWDALANGQRSGGKVG